MSGKEVAETTERGGASLLQKLLGFTQHVPTPPGDGIEEFIATHICNFSDHSCIAKKCNPMDNIPVTIALRWPGRIKSNFQIIRVIEHGVLRLETFANKV